MHIHNQINIHDKDLDQLQSEREQSTKTSPTSNTTASSQTILGSTVIARRHTELTERCKTHGYSLSQGQDSDQISQGSHG